VLRIIQLKKVAALKLHSAYVALAELRAPEDPPILLVAQAEAHLSLGASQWASAELDRHRCQSLGVTVVQRSLGGGLVWLEPAHLNYFFLQSPQGNCRCPKDLLRVLSPGIIATHAAFGFPVSLRDHQEFSYQGRRIGSTGAATLGHSLVLAGSFLLEGDWDTFCQAVAAPSDGFRAQLALGLEESLCTWQEVMARPVSAEAVFAVWQEELKRTGWVLLEDGLSVQEQERMDAMDWEPLDWESSGRRRVAHGIKLRSRAFLTERHWDDGWLRIWTEDHRLRALWGSAIPAELTLASAGLARDGTLLQDLMQGYLGKGAQLWWERMQALAVWSDVPIG